MLQIAFRMIDADGNGVLVRRELLESSFGEQLGRLWKDLDKDSDAHVTREEWEGFFEHLRDRALKKLGDERGEQEYQKFIAELMWRARVDVAKATEPEPEPEPEPEQVLQSQSSECSTVEYGSRVPLAPEPEQEPRSRQPKASKAKARKGKGSSLESLVDGMETKRMRALILQLAAENPEVQQALGGTGDEQGSEPGAELEASHAQTEVGMELEVRESFLQRKPARARPREAELRAAADAVADTSPTRLARKLGADEAAAAAAASGGNGAAGPSARYDLKGKGMSRQQEQLQEMRRKHACVQFPRQP